ncbi:MAG: response regulator [Spirochaetes bacterium]|nr:response regulator [Spirochaetota bacterium]
MMKVILKFYRTLSLKGRLIFLFILTTSLPLVLTSIITLTYFYKQNTDNAKASLNEKLNTADIIYQKKILEIEQISRQVSTNNLILVNMELLLDQPISNYLSYFTTSGRLNFLSIINPEGRLILSGNRQYFQTPEDPVIPENLLNVIRSTGSFNSTIRINSPEFNQIENINTGNGPEILTIISIHPISTYDNRILGYVIAGYVINELSGNTTRASLVSEIESDIDSDIIFISENIPVSYSGGHVGKSDFHIENDLEKELSGVKSGFQLIKIFDKNYLYCLKQINIFNSPHPVFIGTGISEKIFLRLQQSTISILLVISVLSFVVALVLGILSSNHISSPILEMAESTKKIVNGNFKEHIKISSNDEIGMLARAFNSMADKLNRRIQMDTTLSEISRKFININRNETNAAIKSALEEMSRLINADRGYVFLFSEDMSKIHNVHEWHSDTLPSHQKSLKNTAISNYPWFIKKIFNFESIFIPDINNLPHEALVEKKRWLSQEIQSIVCVPMFFGKHLRGFIGFDFHSKPESAIENDIRLLQIVGEIFCNTIERNLAEIRLTQSKNTLKGVFDAQTTMLVSTDRKGNITLWNNAIEKMTGIHSKDAVGCKVWETVPFLLRYQSSIESALKKNRIKFYEKENVFIPLTGKDYYFNISFIPLSMERKSGILIKISDITESLKKDSQLIQIQKMETVRTLAGGLAHDFNNVLGAIVATVSFLNHSFNAGLTDIETIKSNVNLIGSSAQRAGEIIKQLLTLSRKHEPLFKKINLTELINNVVNICHKLLDKSVKINTEINAENTYIYADYSQIEQIILNLCINASHAMTIMRKNNNYTGGILTISLSNQDINNNFYPEMKRGRYIVLKIIDTGVGISQENISKIFDPFFTTKDKTKGTGLGLSMVLNIIKLHNGYINVYSEEGVGSTFNLFFPEHIENEEILNPAVSTGLPAIFHGTGTILVIDDDENIRLATRKILNSCGYDVILAEDGIQGIRLFTEKKDIIKITILDMSMPEMTGDQVFVKLKEISPESVILLTSGFEQDKRVEKLKKAGINGFIRKPYSIYEISEKIHSLDEKFYSDTDSSSN